MLLQYNINNKAVRSDIILNTSLQYTIKFKTRGINKLLKRDDNIKKL